MSFNTAVSLLSRLSFAPDLNLSARQAQVKNPTELSACQTMAHRNQQTEIVRNKSKLYIPLTKEYTVRRRWSGGNFVRSPHITMVEDII